MTRDLKKRRGNVNVRRKQEEELKWKMLADAEEVDLRETLR
jgi:hypothetical protein